jgi:molecular chaperone GrpE (heat shock protein)
MQPVSSEDSTVTSPEETIVPAAEETPTLDVAEPPVTPPEAPDPVVEALARIEDRLAESRRLIERQAEIAANLHAENQRLRAGELRQAQSALIVSVLRVFDDIGQMALTAKLPESREDLGMAAEALADALARNGIERANVEIGAAFDARAHKIAAIEETTDAAADRTVARVVRLGFAWADGTVIRIPDVAVLRHTPA